MFRTEQSSVNPTDVASSQLMSYTSAHGKVNHHLVLYHHFIGEGATQSKSVGLLYLVHTYNQDEPTVRPARTGLQQHRQWITPYNWHKQGERRRVKLLIQTLGVPKPVSEPLNEQSPTSGNVVRATKPSTNRHPLRAPRRTCLGSCTLGRRPVMPHPVRPP